MSDRHEMQAAGTHPAPCARHCEAKAFEIEIRRLRHDIEHHVRIATEATQEAEQLRAELAASREREARMRALIADIKAWDISRFMAIPHELRARMEAALAEGAQG